MDSSKLLILKPCPPHYKLCSAVPGHVSLKMHCLGLSHDLWSHDWLGFVQKKNVWRERSDVCTWYVCIIWLNWMFEQACWWKCNSTSCKKKPVNKYKVKRCPIHKHILSKRFFPLKHYLYSNSNFNYYVTS